MPIKTHKICEKAFNIEFDFISFDNFCKIYMK